MSAPRIDQPQPMFGKTKLVRNGPWVPGRIWLDDSIPERPSMLMAEIDGKEMWDVERAWVSLLGNPITEEEFRFMSAVKDHVNKYEPTAPEAQPRKTINLRSMSMPF